MLPLLRSAAVLGISAALCLSYDSGARAAEPIENSQQKPEGKSAETSQSEKPRYENLLPQTEVFDLREKADAKRHGFDDEDRAFSEELKSKNFNLMKNLAEAIPEYVDAPNAVRELLTRAKLRVRMRHTSQGWRPVRIDGEPYLRAIFAESWIYLSKQSDFRRILENIDYPSVRFEVDLRVASDLAVDEKPRSRIQGNFIALDLALRRSTAKEWKLLSAWKENNVAMVGLNAIGLALYAYEAYKSRNKEDPILPQLRQSPAYKAPVRDAKEIEF